MKKEKKVSVSPALDLKVNRESGFWLWDKVSLGFSALGKGSRGKGRFGNNKQYQTTITYTS
jgi:hypothetical protein